MKAGDLDSIDLSTKIALDVMDIFDGVRARVGHDFANKVSLECLAALVAASTLRALEARPKGRLSKSQEYDIAAENYKTHKVGLQDAVSGGFQGAMSEFCGNFVEFYCQIKLVPEVTNKTVN